METASCSPSIASTCQSSPPRRPAGRNCWPAPKSLAHPRPQGCTPHALPELAQELAVLLEAVPPTPPTGSFEPQLSPAIAVAAALAAVPPILFWYRVASNAIKFQRDIDEKEAARLKLLDKLTGRSRDE